MHSLSPDPIPNNAHAALRRLIQTGSAATGFLKGEIGAPLPGWYRPGEDNCAVIIRLHRALAQRYPDAGPAFWAVRVWTNLVWQPAYLAVIAVHLTASLPDLRGLTQKVEDIHVDGYRLLPGLCHFGAPDVLIDRAGADLRTMADAMLVEINRVTRLKPLPARRLLADRMLGLMLRLSRMHPDLPVADIRRFCDRWLTAMGLSGQGDLQTLLLPDRREVVIVARKGCCLDYLVEPGDYCISCPKQDDSLRLARQRADAAVAL